MTHSLRCLRILCRKADIHFARHFCSSSSPTLNTTKNTNNNSNTGTSVVYPVMAMHKPEDKFSWLSKYGPEFHIRGEQVQIITEPQQFYEILKIKTKKARKRVTFASLYLGNGQLEKDLVSCIDEACQAAFMGEPSSELEVNVLLDFTRGSRGQNNSRTMLQPLMKKWPNVHVALYHTPDLRGWLKKLTPERFNETIGLTHMKVYLFDDSFIISGANLSNDYFTNRQDRYILFNDCKNMSNFFHHLVKTVMSFSLQLDNNDALQLAPDWNIHPYLDSGNGDDFKVAAKEKIDQCLREHICSDVLVIDDFEENNNYVFKEEYADTVVYPLVQMGPFGVQNDEKATVDLLLRSDHRDLVLLTSGYFNLTDQYSDVILCDAEAKFKILMASPKANGFLGAKGVAGAIPYSYIYLSNIFYNNVIKMGQSPRIKMLEYERDGWTFHSKGLWYYLHNEQLPRLTFIGSPNFGFRSVYRDLECQIAMVTENVALQEQLRQEHVHLYTHATQVTAETFERTDRYVPLWTRLVTSVVKHFF